MVFVLRWSQEFHLVLIFLLKNVGLSGYIFARASLIRCLVIAVVLRIDVLLLRLIVLWEAVIANHHGLWVFHFAVVCFDRMVLPRGLIRSLVRLFWLGFDTLWALHDNDWRHISLVEVHASRNRFWGRIAILALHRREKWLNRRFSDQINCIVTNISQIGHPIRLMRCQIDLSLLRLFHLDVLLLVSLVYKINKSVAQVIWHNLEVLLVSVIRRRLYWYKLGLRCVVTFLIDNFISVIVLL